jgi:hypothetical protein
MATEPHGKTRNINLFFRAFRGYLSFLVLE